MLLIPSILLTASDVFSWSFFKIIFSVFSFQGTSLTIFIGHQNKKMFSRFDYR